VWDFMTLDSDGIVHFAVNWYGFNICDVEKWTGCFDEVGDQVFCQMRMQSVSSFSDPGFDQVSSAGDCLSNFTEKLIFDVRQIYCWR
jgi:hypothetical protein